MKGMLLINVISVGRCAAHGVCRQITVWETSFTEAISDLSIVTQL